MWAQRTMEPKTLPGWERQGEGGGPADLDRLSRCRFSIRARSVAHACVQTLGDAPRC